MPVTVSYPGLYLEELPSSARSIVAAPTSIAVFVGYTHPFKTKTFGEPIRIFSFSDFERDFGGVYLSGVIDASVAHAVNQFFLNGGSEAYVVGLKPSYQISGNPPQAITNPTATFNTAGGGGIVFTAQEPTDHASMAMTVRLSNIPPALDRADFTISYGNRIETFRGLSLTTASLDAVNAASSLIRVAPAGGGYGTGFASATPAPVTLPTTLPANLIGTFSALDFADVFEADQPLDKVDDLQPAGDARASATTACWSAALAFCERKRRSSSWTRRRNAVADGERAAGDHRRGIVDAAAPSRTSQNGALYFPYLKSIDPLTGEPIELPPSGFVAGIYARTDTNRGVWKAPAGLETRSSTTPPASSTAAG